MAWEQSSVLFVTMNIPGGSNNDDDAWYSAAKTGTQIQEVAQRSAADLRWLDAAFAKAVSHRDRAVVIMEQADMWDLDGKPASHIANYEVVHRQDRGECESVRQAGVARQRRFTQLSL